MVGFIPKTFLNVGFRAFGRCFETLTPSAREIIELKNYDGGKFNL